MNTRGAEGSRPMTVGKIILFSVIGIAALWTCFQFVANLSAHQIMCIQNPITGHLAWHVTPGPKIKLFGKVTKYDKRGMYKFQIPVRFNDGGHGTINGSIQYEMPLDKEHLTDIQYKFGSEEAVTTSLIQTVVNKSIYMTGPMMSSRESFAEKRNYLISWVEDQIQNGIFKTASRDTILKDQLTGADKTITKVEIVLKNGVPERQEESTLTKFGIKTFNFAIERLPYDESVEKQIQQQQQITMAVQTSIAEAKQAEQKAITAEANGKAEAAKAKWEQEAKKAKAVTIAEKDRDSCKLVMEAAGYKKQALILEGTGLAEKEKLIQSANGNLDKKLAAWIEGQKYAWEALGKYQGNLVPTWVMGNTGGATANALGTPEMISLMLAKQLGLDMSMGKGEKK